MHSCKYLFSCSRSYTLRIRKIRNGAGLRSPISQCCSERIGIPKCSQNSERFIPYSSRKCLSSSAGAMLPVFSSIEITPIYVYIMRPNVYFVNILWVYTGNKSDLWAHEKSPAPNRTGLSQVEAVNQFNHPRACPMKP